MNGYLFGRGALGTQKVSVDSTTGASVTLDGSKWYRVYCLGADAHFMLYNTSDGASAPSVIDFTADADNASAIFINGEVIRVYTANYNRCKLLTDSGTATVWFIPVESRA